MFFVLFAWMRRNWTIHKFSGRKVKFIKINRKNTAWLMNSQWYIPVIKQHKIIAKDAIDLQLFNSKQAPIDFELIPILVNQYKHDPNFFIEIRIDSPGVYVEQTEVRNTKKRMNKYFIWLTYFIFLESGELFARLPLWKYNFGRKKKWVYHRRISWHVVGPCSWFCFKRIFIESSPKWLGWSMWGRAKTFSIACFGYQRQNCKIILTLSFLWFFSNFFNRFIQIGYFVWPFQAIGSLVWKSSIQKSKACTKKTNWTYCSQCFSRPSSSYGKWQPWHWWTDLIFWFVCAIAW